MYGCISGGKKSCFLENLACFVFLETPILSFALLPYYRRKILVSSDSIGWKIIDNQSQMI